MSNLERFLWAQEGIYEGVVAELTAGHKTSHWMWFIFPQVAGLGRSATAQKYAIQSRAEAESYLAHDVLGARLRECCQLLLLHRGKEATQMLGGIDALKLRSSLTLFAAVSSESCFQEVLDAFYNGEQDKATLDILRSWGDRTVH